MSKITNKRNNLILPSVIFLFLIAWMILRYGETWLRHLLLYLSNAVWARSLVSSLPIANRVARRFVAGETIADAIQASKTLNDAGMRVTLDFLGESVNNREEALNAGNEILRLLDHIDQNKLDANVSVKLSQIGLKIDKNLTVEIMQSLLERAASYGNMIRMDMEESALVDTTLEIYRDLRYKHGFENVGVVMQAYLFRSEQDVRELINEGAWVRLCKGAYMEPPEVAFPEKNDTDANFVQLTQMLLAANARENGVYLGVATHDEQMINATIDFVHKERINSDEFEFQMLYGVRRDLQDLLVKQGYQVRVYVPYGTAWYPYFVRRLAERPANLWFFISNFIRR